MTGAELQAALTTRALGRHAEVHAQLPSTQTRAQDLACAGAAHGTLVYAAAQSKGRGRAGRLWLSGIGSLTFSLVLREGIDLAHASDWSFIAGLALHDAFSAVSSTMLQLKWPNDVLADGKKCAGILCSFELAPSPAVVVGIGVNLQFEPGSKDHTLSARAAALPAPALRHQDWLARICKAIERRADAYLGEGRAAACAAYRERLAYLGTTISVTTEHGSDSGIVRGVNDDFELLLERADGSTIAITSADVWPLETRT